MNSSIFSDFLREGVIPPIRPGDTKELVLDKVGEPDDWKGKIEGFSWSGPLIKDFRDAHSWHYGSVIIKFDGDLVRGASLDYSETLKPVTIVDSFRGLPKSLPTLEQLIDFLISEEIEHVIIGGESDICLKTIGGVSVGCKHGRCMKDSRVSHLFSSLD